MMQNGMYQKWKEHDDISKISNFEGTDMQDFNARLEHFNSWTVFSTNII